MSFSHCFIQEQGLVVYFSNRFIQEQGFVVYFSNRSIQEQGFVVYSLSITKPACRVFLMPSHKTCLLILAVELKCMHIFDTFYFIFYKFAFCIFRCSD